MIKLARRSSNALIGCAAALALASPASALDERLRELADRTTSGLVSIEGDLGRLAETGVAELANRDLEDGSVGGIRRYTAAEVESWLREARVETTRARNAVNQDARALDEGRLEGGEERFILNCYRNLERPLAKMWEAQLLFAGNRRGSVARLLGDLRRYERTVAAGDPRAHSEQRRRIFLQLGKEYTAVRDRVAAARKKWVIATQGWIESAREKTVLRGDAHARGAELLEKTLMRLFSYRSLAPSSSEFDYFVDASGSPDRLITGYSDYPWCKARPFPELQSADGSCNVLRMHSAAAESIAALRPPRGAAGDVRVFWRIPGNETSRRHRLESGREVVAVRYRRGQTLAVLAEVRGIDPSRYVSALVLKDVNPAGGGRSVRISRELLGPIARDASGLAVIPLDLDSVLRRLGTRANLAVLEAAVELEVNGKRLQASTQNGFHPVVQKLIVFLPGVPGSRIWVKAADEASEEAWLRWSFGVFGEPPAALLACDAQGRPVNASTKVDLLRIFEPWPPVPLWDQSVYDVDEREELLNPPGHPPVFSDGKRIPYYVVHSLPYDWRHPPTTTLEFLRGERPRRDANGSTSAPYADPPSLEAVRKDAAGRLPFLDEKMVLAGHSTGGLLARKLLTEPARAAMFDQAFFIDVPFFGAPKAYEVFLNGNMGIEPVLNKIMRDLAANLPILYFLAPTQRYPGAVLRWRRKHTEPWKQLRRSEPRFAGVMDELVDLAAAAGRPRELRWNKRLADDAAAFHAGLIQNHLGEENCTVFYSSRANTTDMVQVGPERREFYASLWIQPVHGPGDETVTVVSQQGEFAGGPRLVRIPSNPDHVAASSDRFVWNAIRERIELRLDPAPLRIP